MSKFAFVGPTVLDVPTPLRQEPQCVGEREREAAGRVNTMAAVFCVDCGQKLTGQYCGKCGRDYGATAAAQRASSPLATATVQHVGSSAIAGAQQDVSSLTAEALRAVSPATAGAQRAVAEVHQDVSSSTAGAQRAVSPMSRPRSLSTPAGMRGRGPGGFTLGKNITDWRDGPMGRFVKPMSAAAASDGAEAIEAARRARDAQFVRSFVRPFIVLTAPSSLKL
jgi:hypothetical protein